MSENDATGDAAVHEEVPGPEVLHRSTTNRKVAGVAGGIGERFDIDANVVRVVFVILTLVAGLGAAIYLAMWALVPLNGSHSGDRVARTAGDEHRWTFRALLLLAGALCLGLIFLSVLLNGPNVGRGISGFWLIFLVVLAVASLRRPGRFRIGRFLLGILATLVSLAVLASGGVLAYVAATGVPIEGGVGQRVYQPSSVSEIQHQYHLAIGTMNIDLRGVGFNHATRTIVATIGIGQLMVEIPQGVQVNLNAQSGGSAITYPGGRQSFYFSGTAKNPTSHLDLTVRVGIGRVELYRLTPGAPIVPYLP
jgi:phage shock protein PspC (stress-responsive transcriptional regulator)